MNCGLGTDHVPNRIVPDRIGERSHKFGGLAPSHTMAPAAMGASGRVNSVTVKGAEVAVPQ